MQLSGTLSKLLVDTVLQNLKSFSYESVASFSKKHEHLEEKLASVATTQEVMVAN